MKLLHASLLFTNDGPPVVNADLTLTDEGVIVEIGSGGANNKNDYRDVIIPAFINAHCHLELSHLKGLIRERENGMTGFIRQLLSQRFLFSDAVQQEAMQLADQSMLEEGIVAVGDISNFTSSAGIKKNSRLYYHTFIELFGLENSKVEEMVLNGISMVNEFRGAPHLSSSLSPHAPYSMVQDLFKEISRVVHPIDPLTIHMQESEDEILFCKDKSGPLAEFFASAGISTTDFIPFGDVRPLRQILPLIPRANRLQLVHNTYTAEEEIVAALKRRPKLSWCLCPSANLFITGDLPPVEALFRNDAHVTIGTDSLASNQKLSVLNELKLISKNFPMVPFATLVKWSTLNGAEFLGVANRFGKIKPGMNPGLVSLHGLNHDELVLHEQVTCKRVA